MCYHEDMTEYHFIVKELSNPERIDRFLASRIDDFSRTQIQTHIKSGLLTINQIVVTKPKYLIANDDHICVTLTHHQDVSWQPQHMNLNICYEDDHLMIINKPRDCIVHPGNGHPDHTLLNGLIHYNPALVDLPRAGIVHRLDKDTTGLMIIAKQPKAYQILVQDLADRTIKRVYEAVVVGKIAINGFIDRPIGRHKIKRTQMSIQPDGRPAQTYYEIIEGFEHYTHIRCRLITGRTHQIRVHMLDRQYPLVGDPTYHGGYLTPPNCLHPELRTAIEALGRQALHAKELHFTHPITKEILELYAKLPEDLQRLITQLKSHDR